MARPTFNERRTCRSGLPFAAATSRTRHAPAGMSTRGSSCHVRRASLTEQLTGGKHQGSNHGSPCVPSTHALLMLSGVRHLLRADPRAARKCRHAKKVILERALMYQLYSAGVQLPSSSDRRRQRHCNAPRPLVAVEVFMYHTDLFHLLQHMYAGSCRLTSDI
jgi:hypothetical protein